MKDKKVKEVSLLREHLSERDEDVIVGYDPKDKIFLVISDKRIPIPEVWEGCSVKFR